MPSPRLPHDLYSTATGIPPRKSKRPLYFLMIFLPALLASQIYIFSQPALYRSEATVLTTAATQLDQTSQQADLQHVAIQKDWLLGQTILEMTAKELQKQQTANLVSADDLRSMLAATPVTGTNLLQLTAEGRDPHFLQLTVNTWIDAYRTVRAEYIKILSEKSLEELSDELTRIEKQVNDKRQEIDKFKIAHDIVSDASAENQAHSRLLGLNESLNKALDDEVTAKANIDAIHHDLAQGKNVVPETDSLALSVLIDQAGKLRQKLSDLRGQYTEEYINFNPQLHQISLQLTRLDAEIAEKKQQGKEIIIHEAENSYAAAHQAVIDLQRELAEHKKTASEYTSQFSQYQSLQNELSNLETVRHDTKQRLSDIEVKQRQQYPQVEVIDTASLPGTPFKPDYKLQAGLGFAASVALGLLFVMILDFLTREKHPVTPNIIYKEYLNVEPRSALANLNTFQQQLNSDPLSLLSADTIPNEVSHDEILRMYNVAEPNTKACLVLLLNGLSATEIMSLTQDNLDFEHKNINIPAFSRSLAMTEMTIATLSEQIWEPITINLEEMDALLCCAAIDAGLSLPEAINAAAISFTYCLFLVRQGIKLSDLAKILGPISPVRLKELGKFSPDTAKLPLEKIQLDYFMAAE